MTTQYFAGNSLAAFSRTNVAIAESTTAGRFDSTYVANAMLTSSTADTFATPTLSITGTLWFRFDAYQIISGTQNTLGVTLYNGATGVFRVVATSTTLFQCQYWNGSSWTATGTTFARTANTLQTLVFKVILNTSFEAYLAGSLVASGGSWSGGGTTVTKAEFTSFQLTGNGSTWYSQIMIADYDIRDSHFMPKTLNGNSASNTGAASGVYTDLNETALDESTALAISASGNKAGQTHAAITVPAGFIIGAMVIAGRGRATGTITDAKLGVRSGGGTNSSGSALSYTGGYEPRFRIIASDPDTSTNFTQSGFNNAEIYEEAV